MNSPRLVEPTPLAYGYPFLIKRILEQPLNYEPDREVIYRDQYRRTYTELNERVAQTAQALIHLGIQPGDVIGVMEYDSPRYLELYFAIPMIGAVLHTINFKLSDEQIVYTINHAEDTLILCNSTLLPILNKNVAKIETVEKYVVLAEKGDEAEAEFEVAGSYEELIAKEPSHYEFPDFDENTMATLFYTTGTTGLPKGVYYSHRQLVMHTLGVATSVTGLDSAIRITSSDIYMPLTPMFHVHAWGIPYLATMLGMKQVYPGPYEASMLGKLLFTEEVTFSHCVPTVLRILIEGAKSVGKKLDQLKVIIGGSAFPKGLATAALEIGINATTGYGLSETCPVLTIPYISKRARAEQTKEELIEERIKTGRPILFVEMEIMNDEGNKLPKDGKNIGELVVRAPWLTQRYFKEEERSKELWKYGYLHTGDMAYIEPNGTVVIVDRKKDVIKSGGEWISSLELESLISAHPAVKQAAVIGIQDEEWGERPLALVIPETWKKTNEEEIKAYLQQYIQSGYLSKWAIPDHFKFVEEIPKTSVGKLNKKEIRKRFKEGKL